MNAKNFLLVWLLAFVLLFGLNGVFHGVLAAPFFDGHFAHLGCVKKMSESNPAPVAILDLVLSFGMTLVITRKASGRIGFAEAALLGGLLNLISSGAWNLANVSLMDWPVTVTIGDIAWHVALGCGGGILIAALANWRMRKA